MYQRIKDVLNSTFTWLIFLAGCVLYFWKKEKDLEFELEQEKINETIKDDQQAVSQADNAADASTNGYKSLRDAYLRGHKDDT